MPAAPPLTGLVRDIVALAVNLRQVRRADLEEMLGHSRSVIVRGLAVAVEGGYITPEGATRNLHYVPTERAKKARALTSDNEDGTANNEQITHYGARLAEDYRVKKVVDAAHRRGGRTVDNSVRVRRATPEELARPAEQPARATARVVVPVHSITEEEVALPTEPVSTSPDEAAPAHEPDRPAGEIAHLRLDKPVPAFVEVVDEPIVPTLDDVTLAREQLRARYVLALIGAVEAGNVDAGILDRIESQLAPDMRV